MSILIVPGLNDSGPLHWQSWFEAGLPGCRRVMQSDWEMPDLPRWGGVVRETMEQALGPCWIVAHSFGCLATAYALARSRRHVAGAMLVAPADPARFDVSSAVPRTALPCPAIVVGSENDPWMSLDRTRHWAQMWDATFVNAGAAGHINVASGHGPWPEGMRMLRSQQSGAARDAVLPSEIEQIGP
jgi:predicted alpha/beta hydrolase family esterase